MIRSHRNTVRADSQNTVRGVGSRIELSSLVRTWLSRRTRLGYLTALLLFVSASVHGATGGSLSGMVVDPSGAVIVGANLTLSNSTQQNPWHASSDRQGFYTFPSLPVGRYSLTIAAIGFTTQERPNIQLDIESAIRLDLVLTVATHVDDVLVKSELIERVNATTTYLGEAITSTQAVALPLNGRSYTDLLAMQPGVAPISTLVSSSVIMAGVTGSLDPSGDLNPGNLSINGQRESSNGFFVNGIDVQEHMNGGTSIILNLDSIDEFRVLTDNFDAEYGNYNGGVITVISKSGTRHFHGEAFDFFRNTNLDARGFFDRDRSIYRQNQFGGTLGGPVTKRNSFIFADYQGTRTQQGVSTGNISVPTIAERDGDFFDSTTQQSRLTGNVSGPHLASLLSQELGYTVTAREPYSAVFPDGAIPRRAWSAPAINTERYIPRPNTGDNQFSTSAYSEAVRDDKAAMRLDTNHRTGQLSAYYFVDDYELDNPYPGAVAGASIPGFDAVTFGRAQLFSLGDTALLGTNAVNEFHLGVLRNSNVVGKPKGGLGVTLASQGFVTGKGTPGIYVQAPQFEGVENITFPSFVMGVPITNLTQVNNTAFLSDGLTKVIGPHTLKLGAEFHADEVNEKPNATFNGTFNINGTETGSAYADFLIGTPSNYTQSSGRPFYLRNRYIGLYGQDSWRVRKNMTINVGLRWDRIMPFWEKYNQLQTYIEGRRSTIFPGALPGLLVVGDPGVPKTIAPTGNKNFAPRLGLAYSPQTARRFWRSIIGSGGQSSIRASYGLFFTEFPGLAAGIMYAVPPFGYNYLSPAPPLFATPFITAATGVDNGQRFPFSFPSNKVSRSNPDASVDWANFTPLSADPFFDHRNQVPYLNEYMLSAQRQLTSSAILTVNYVGNQGHHILAVVSANNGNSALCLSLPGCGPFGEDSTYTASNGQNVYGTRLGQNRAPRIGPGENYGNNTSDSTIANSSYNALQTTLRYQHDGSQFLFGYSYSKSIDQGSNLGEQLNPIDPRQSRAISAWDQKQSFEASYTWVIPLASVFSGKRSLADNWTLSGDTRFASGFPVTLFDTSDKSLLGTLGNGVNNYLLDTPRFLQGPLRINTNGRNRRLAFDTSLFPEEIEGTLGNSRRRMFYGPGIENFDLTLEKLVHLSERRSVALRIESFNVFNHAQFYGPAAVDGQAEDPNFGKIVSAAAPRLVQIAARISF
ncbi:carboxypeptidase regulatory-like domain-containing protein [Acidobacteria bacterium AB60]|nr:carboxypeptidase regulatory-like domain-containing protein [Acidobacteria bacterium AB60]